MGQGEGLLGYTCAKLLLPLWTWLLQQWLERDVRLRGFEVGHNLPPSNQEVDGAHPKTQKGRWTWPANGFLQDQTGGAGSPLSAGWVLAVCSFRQIRRSHVDPHPCHTPTSPSRLRNRSSPMETPLSLPAPTCPRHQPPGPQQEPAFLSACISPTQGNQLEKHRSPRF